jgi:hypothetical protein
LDRAKIPGASRPLKTKLDPSPFVVIRTLPTTTLIRRLSDSATRLFSNNDIKKYEGGNKYFESLPKEVKNILVYKFEELLNEDFCTLAKIDPLNLPEGITLQKNMEDNDDNDNSFSLENITENSENDNIWEEMQNLENAKV